MQVELSKEEIQFILAGLNSANFQGLETAKRLAEIERRLLSSLAPQVRPSEVPALSLCARDESERDE